MGWQLVVLRESFKGGAVALFSYETIVQIGIIRIFNTLFRLLYKNGNGSVQLLLLKRR